MTTKSLISTIITRNLRFLVSSQNLWFWRHRPLPEDGTIKEVRLKEEKSGKWYVSVVVDYDPEHPEKPPVDSISVEDTVGIDLGILKLVHDSNGTAVLPLDESTDRERIEKCHRALARKQHGSNNWEKARIKLAEAYETLTNKRTDFIEKLARSYTKQYDAVFLEDLNVRGMLEQDSNGRNITAMSPSEARLLTRNRRFLVMSWYETFSTFKRHGDKNACHVITVSPEGTTKRCARCDVASSKALWVREHSCPSCRYEANRDENAVARCNLAGSQNASVLATAFNAQKLGLEELGIDYEIDELLGLGEAEDTSAETALPTGANLNDKSLFCVVSAKRVRQNRRFWLAARRSLATSLKQEATGHLSRGNSHVPRWATVDVT